MNILFITRNYPPVKGGTQKVAFELYSRFSKKADVELIKWGKSGKWMPLVMPFFLLKSFFVLLTKKIDVVYLGDGVVSPLGVFIKVFFRKPVAITIHGFDITYNNSLYQAIIPWCVAKMDKVICVSSYTKDRCVDHGISASRIEVIYNGISDEFFIKDKSKEEILRELYDGLGVNLEDKKILLSVGRSVKRKGFDWFIDNVFCKIAAEREKVLYLIVSGGGPSMKSMEESIDRLHLEGRVIIASKVNDEYLRKLYNVADVFIMPNIKVKNNIEGFGLVNLEAASCRLPVIASGIDGMCDAVINGKNGLLAEAMNPSDFYEKIDRLLLDEDMRIDFGKKAREYTLENYNWSDLSDLYLKTFSDMITF